MTTTLLASDWPTLTGRQEPQNLLCDVGDESEAVKAITLAVNQSCQKLRQGIRISSASMTSTSPTSPICWSRPQAWS